jgi:dTDP-4-dehydrorhamnose reductase
MTKKIYIAGSGGMLGEAFYSVFKKDYHLKCTDIDVNEDWISFLDFRDFDAYQKDVFDFQPDYLFHLGAYTDLEFCEKNPDDTYLTNTLSTENAVLIANELNIPVLYISTAGIFDGNQEFYDDWDIPNPVGVYARSKYCGERYVVEHAKKYLVCRAGWMMGGGPNKDKKFVNKIIKQIDGGARNLNIVHDKSGTPTYTFDFAQTVKALAEKELWGLYNVVSRGKATRLDVAKEILSTLGLDKKISISPVSSTYFEKTYFAPRPESEHLITKKLDLRGLKFMQHWKVALKEYLHKDFAGIFSA